MERMERTDGILHAHRRLCETCDNVGVTLQAYLYRTDEGLPSTLERPGRVRLVKGSYEDPVAPARSKGRRKWTRLIATT